ncbi:hypothetical protein HMI01_09700 [Halolactibacillus miurensis]|uniref:Uncharacterized protein n=1 Tax=Halolactibacillus miurensis TaxID=306541 RepID=A0A1I6SB48_9BACI|nr:hypothetical protein [Halolactibacillus miurensis]GEM03982.1 hypothetical protein HMI01_09700 [Halolactibacillus miurensis]SFS74189.1 hypothetical protein SAMN05421668_10852 [Halolactibacillus miurensis]
MSSLIYFHAAETAKGRRDFLSSQLQGIDKIVEINEPTRYEASRMLDEILHAWEKESSIPDTIECLLDPLNPRLKVAIINRTKRCACVTPVRVINENIRASYYQALQSGLVLHDDLEAIYQQATDFNLLNQFVTTFIAEHIPPRTDLEKSGQPITFHRFLGSTTAYGTIDFIPKLTENVSRRYFIKGRAGTGKSTALKKVAQAARSEGYQTEVYHCGFDPDSLDMVIIRELDLAIFDSTLPHEHFPTREGDELIDLYGTFIKNTIDDDYASEIAELNNKINEETKKAIKLLQQDEQQKKQQEDLPKNIVIAFNDRLKEYVKKLNE